MPSSATPITSLSEHHPWFRNKLITEVRVHRYAKMLMKTNGESNSITLSSIAPVETSAPRVAAAAFYHCLGAYRRLCGFISCLTNNQQLWLLKTSSVSTKTSLTAKLESSFALNRVSMMIASLLNHFSCVVVLNLVVLSFLLSDFVYSNCVSFDKTRKKKM